MPARRASAASRGRRASRPGRRGGARTRRSGRGSATARRARGRGRTCAPSRRWRRCGSRSACTPGASARRQDRRPAPPRGAARRRLPSARAQAPPARSTSTGLRAGTTYYFRVAAVNGVGAGAYNPTVVRHPQGRPSPRAAEPRRRASGPSPAPTPCALVGTTSDPRRHDQPLHGPPIHEHHQRLDHDRLRRRHHPLGQPRPACAPAPPTTSASPPSTASAPAPTTPPSSAIPKAPAVATRPSAPTGVTGGRRHQLRARLLGDHR